MSPIPTPTHSHARFAGSLVAVFVSFTFFAVMLLVISDSVLLREGVDIFPPAYILLMLLISLAEALAGHLFYKDHPAPVFRRSRELFFVILLSFVFVLLLHGESRPIAATARAKVWVPVLCLAAQWLLGCLLHQHLGRRERFLALLTNSNTRSLRQIYRSYSHAAAESLEGLKTAKKVLIILQALGIVGLAVTSWILGITYTGWALFFTLFFFVSFLWIIAVINSWSDRQLLMADGLSIKRTDRRLWRTAALITMAAALIIVAPSARTDAPLPDSYLEKFVVWLEELGGIEFARSREEAPAFDLSMISRFDSVLEGLDPQESDRPAGTQRFTSIALCVLLGIIAAAFSAFLFLPIFRSKRGGYGPRRVLKRLAEFARSAVNLLRGLVAGIHISRKPVVSDRIMRPKALRRAKAGESAAPSTGLVPGIGEGSRLRSYYKRFVKFGEKRGAVFSYSTGPKEYAMKVADLIPETADECLTIATMYEEAAYSQHELEDGVALQFKKIVKDVIRSGRSSDWKR